MTGLQFLRVSELNFQAINLTIIEEYDKLMRMVQRQQNVSEPVPPFFIRTLLDLELAVNNVAPEAKKKMNASNAKGLTAMKQKVKKAVKEFEKEIKQYQTVRSFFSAVVLSDFSP
jgi:translation initiation factor 3 subunit C